MANDTESAHVINGSDEAHVSCASSKEEEEVKLLSDVVRRLPSHAVKDLLSIGVCVRCIFRVFGIHQCNYSFPLMSSPTLCAILGKAMESEGDTVDNGYRAHEDSICLYSSEELEMDIKLCRVCLGILQYVYIDEKEMMIKRDSGNDFAIIIADVVKQDGHEINNFSLEVSLPKVVMENDRAIWLYMKKNYDTEAWFQEKCKPECISAKDVFKMSITNPLETLLGVKSGLSSFRIRLTYTHYDASTQVQNSMERNGCKKKRKTGTDDVLETIDGSVVAGIKCSNFFEKEHELSKCKLQDHGISDCFNFQLEKVNQPCRLTFLCCRAPIYIGGRYLKYSRNVSQTRWIINDERRGEASVEEIISGSMLPIFQGDSYKFHAAGREDIDVRMLGSGRPFLVEIQNARHVPSEVFIKEIEMQINSLESKLVRVKSLKILGTQGWTLIWEGEAEKQKQYAALVWISRSLTDDDMQTISSLKNMQILQRTPIRVLHRRSPLAREKIIYWMKIERIAGSSQYFLLHLCTQAGTYIKEFVHGDLGRTHPSIGSIMGCRAEILQLDVTDVKMDISLDE
ncbi:unnamed protein product [Ilex paraguariensis]|uniref:tRNA pseudouridine(55) synthase n=1 Tax=Ilex paraguariensis TaxID=185542 RepID=A0ABC8U9C0_9AQUA